MLPGKVCCALDIYYNMLGLLTFCDITHVSDLHTGSQPFLCWWLRRSRKCRQIIKKLGNGRPHHWYHHQCVRRGYNYRCLRCTLCKFAEFTIRKQLKNTNIVDNWQEMRRDEMSISHHLAYIKISYRPLALSGRTHRYALKSLYLWLKSRRNIL